MAKHYEDVLTDKGIYCVRKRGFEMIVSFDNKFSPDLYFVDFSCISFKGIEVMYMIKKIRAITMSRKVFIRRKVHIIGYGANRHLFKIVDRWVDSVHDI